MSQGGLFDDIPELRFCQDIFVKSKKLAKSRLPSPVVRKIQVVSHLVGLADSLLEFRQQLD